MSLKAFVNDKHQWDAFCSELDVWIFEQHKRLEQADNTIEKLFIDIFYIKLTCRD